MKKIIRNALNRLAWRIGCEVIPIEETPDFPVDLTEAEIATWQRVRGYTMTSPELMASLTRAIEHIHHNTIPGDIVECGVWRGGSMMAAAITLQSLNAERDIYLFDTFEGMPDGSEFDKNWKEETVAQRRRDVGENWARAQLEEVQYAMSLTGYPSHRMHFVKGLVEETIPSHAPESIAILRLDTDFYDSTLHELTHLYPRLSPGGILIIDDYGHWQGCRKAVDEYFGGRVHLTRLDYSVRLIERSLHN